MVYVAEPLPTKIIKETLDTAWTTLQEIPKPVLVDMNDGTTGIRHDQNIGDLVVIQLASPGEEETWRDSWYYVDRTNRAEILIYTKHSRQRLYDLKQEIRRIIHLDKHALTNYQVWRYSGFTEFNKDQFNMWAGQVACTLENNRIVMEQ